MAGGIYVAFYKKTQLIELVTEQITEPVTRLVGILKNTTLTTKDIMELLELKHRPTFLYTYLKQALEQQLVEMTNPNSPKSSNQKYRLFQKGLNINIK